ncbi:MAG: hypothetical protein MJ072_01615 [Clostridia bacterium]|nr:hypothetical protein [Clostridia bacterium]
MREEKDASYTETGGYRVENVLFKNVSFTSVPDYALPPLIKSVNKDDGSYGVFGVTLDNVTVNGNKIRLDDFIIEGNVKP